MPNEKDLFFIFQLLALGGHLMTLTYILLHNIFGFFGSSIGCLLVVDNGRVSRGECE
jgi:hypothetical protein